MQFVVQYFVYPCIHVVYSSYPLLILNFLTYVIVVEGDHEPASSGCEAEREMEIIKPSPQGDYNYVRIIS